MNLLNFVTFSTAVLWQANQARGQGETIGCFVEGECMRSLLVQSWSTPDPQECLELCREFGGCEYFTHFADDDYCSGFANCEEFGNDTCDDCYSGGTDCEDLVCWDAGFCDGEEIDSFAVESNLECLESCKSAKDCLWFTYQEDVGVCYLMATCPFVDVDSCYSCLIGQKQCSEPQDLTKIMVLGGFYVDDLALNSVEVLDMSSEVNGCQPVAPYPLQVAYPVGALINGRPRFCGGFVEVDVGTDRCFEYLKDTNSWAEVEPLLDASGYGSKSSMLGNDLWIISGGYIDFGTYLDVTQVWGEDAGFQRGPQLPDPMTDHCQVSISATEIFFAGNDGNAGPMAAAYILDWSANEWTQLPDMSISRWGLACGYIKNAQNGKGEVVVASQNTSEIFSLETFTWRDGPPIELSGDAATVQQEKNFLVIGGFLGPVGSWANPWPYMDTVLEFDEVNYLWVRKSATLQQARSTHAAVAVPDAAVNC